jgi:hypothetical protein
VLNDTHKYLIKESIQRLFFAEIEALPSDIQILACKAALSLSFYTSVESTLKAHNLENCVKEVGMLLTHPCPENPRSLCVELGEKSAIDPSTVIEKVEGGLKSIPIGILNLKVKNTPGFEAQSEEVIDFAKTLIVEKFPELTEVPVNAVATSSSDNQNVSSVDISKLSTSMQLAVLNISIEALPKCTTETFDSFQKFLIKVGVLKESLTSVDSLNKSLEIWFNTIKKEYEETCKLIGPKNSTLLTLANIIDAKLGRFDLVMKSPINFYICWALQRLALANGHTGMIEYLKPDYSDIVRLLIKAKKKDELKTLLTLEGKKIPHYHANFIFLKYFEEDTLDIEIIEILLGYLQISDVCKLNILENYALNKNRGNDLFERLLQMTLFDLKFKLRMTLNAALEAFKCASNSGSFQLLISVLLHCPDEFASRMFICRDVFFSCLKKGLVQTALKFASMEFPRQLSMQDLVEAEAISQGKICFDQIRVSDVGFVFAIPTKQDNPQAITPLLQLLQSQQRQALPSSSPAPEKESLRLK